MSPRRRNPEIKEPDLSPERALPAFKKQLESLQKLKGRPFQEAESEEQEWQHLTQSIVERAFGNPSSNLTKYNRARNAGEYFIRPYGYEGYGYADPQDQRNFEARMTECEAVLKSFVAELELFMPEREIKGAYDIGDEYSFYRDLKGIIGQGQREIFIVDNYLDEQIFDIYVNRVPDGVTIRMLSRGVPAAVKTVAEKYGKVHPGFELRVSGNTHDRVVFIDDRCWVIGQSMKDAARSKPTYIVEVDPTSMKRIYEDLWKSGTGI
jgi:hypothetical protein